jgi:hypothetical protein
MNKSLFGLTLAVAFTAVSIFSTQAMAAPPPINHNCTNAVTSAKLQEKIDKAVEGDVIEVTGDCIGVDYVMARDRLTLRGIDGATITGTGASPAITVTHDETIIEGWDLIDGGINHGVVVRASGSALVRDILVISGVNGVQVIDSSFVEVDNVAIQVTGDGIAAISNGSAVIRNTDISDNPDDGVVAAGGGQVSLAGGNTIENNGDFGIIVAAGQANIDGSNTVQGNRIDLDCRQFSRVRVVQSITSSTDILRSSDCEVSEAFGAAVFENNPQSLVICSEGETISQTLANGVTDIVVRGLCDEQVTVTDSNVTIRGENLGPVGEPVDGIQTVFSGSTILVRGAQNVNLIDLKLTGGRNTVTSIFGGAAIINNGNISAGGPVGGGRFGLFVGDNSWVQLTNTVVLGGSGGGALANRTGTMRVFNSTISGGGTDKIALTLNDSVAYLYGTNFVGQITAHFNSRFAFFNQFLGTFYGNSVINSSVGPGQCSRYSNISAFPGDIVISAALPPVPYVNADFFSFSECQVTIE